MNDYESCLKHILAYWAKQPDKEFLTLNPMFVEDMVKKLDDAASKGAILNPEYLTAKGEFYFGGPVPEQIPIFIVAADTKRMDWLDETSLRAEFYLDMAGEPDVRNHIDKAMAK